MKPDYDKYGPVTGANLTRMEERGDKTIFEGITSAELGSVIGYEHEALQKSSMQPVDNNVAAIAQYSRLYANIYLVASIAISVLLFNAYPPFQSPHEAQHYLHGMTFSRMYKDTSLPASMREYPRAIRLKRAPLEQGVERPQVPESLNKGERSAYGSPRNVAVYPFINYIPQMITGTLGEIFSLAPHSIYQATRALCLTLGIGFGYLILRLLPAYHLPALIMLLLPSLWVMRIQQYPGQVVNVAALLFFALLLRILHQRTKVTFRQVAALVVTGVVLSASKIVYMPLVLTALILRKEHFHSFRHRMLVMSCVIGLSAFASAGACLQAMHVDYGMHLSEQEQARLQNHPRYPRWQRKQAALYDIVTKPVDVTTKVFSHFLAPEFWRYTVREIIWWHMNRLAPLLQKADPYIFYALLLPFVFCPLPAGSGSNTGQAYVSDVRSRMILLFSLFMALLAVSLALYTGDGRGVHGNNIQGRYLSPLLPFVMGLCGVGVARTWVRWYLLAYVFFALLVFTVFYLGIVGMV